jgi:hypothetical protein
MVIQLAFALAMSYYDRQSSFLLTLVNFLASGLFLLSFALLLKRAGNGIASLAFGLLLLILVMINGLKLMLLIFSGNGFSSEVFYHLEPTSFAVGWSEFGAPLLFLGVPLLLLSVFMVRHFHRPLAHPLNIGCLLSVWALAILGMSLTYQYSPPVQAWKNWQIYNAYHVSGTPFDESEFQPFIDAGIVNSLNVLRTDSVRLKPVSQAKNLILIYLESFNLGLTIHPDYPGLTPFINSLQTKYPSTNHHFSSSFVTIGGIVSSQCGTLLPMFRENDSLMELSGIMPDMACLGDILDGAAYQQFFFGGAELEFAGKGKFLKAHGYERTFGWRDWKSQDKPMDTEVWGLSDPLLFQEALKTIRRVHKRPPFNVTLLTLGTHLPGFVYDECEVYQDQAPLFVNAIHCTDQALKQFINDLQAEQLLENTLVFIMGDHGVFPTREMYSLFGDMVDDRRLLTIAFPAPQLTPGWRMSTYDVAPTLLDLLHIGHDQEFLYGRSVIQDEKTRPYVTRYYDWVDGKLLSRQKGDCEQDVRFGDEAMTQCISNKLMGLTQKFHERYSSRPAGRFGCIFADAIRISRKQDEPGFELVFAGQGARKSFTRNGYFIRKIESGFYLVELNENNDILARDYFNLSEEDLNKMRIRLALWPTSKRLVLVYLSGPEPLPDTILEPLLLRQITARQSFVYFSPYNKLPAYMKEFDLEQSSFSMSSETCQGITNGR